MTIHKDHFVIATRELRPDLPKPIRQGAEGHILATRPCIDDQALVKWKGRSMPVSVPLDGLKKT